MLNDTKEKAFLNSKDFMIIVPILNLFKFKTEFNISRFTNHKEKNYDLISKIIDLSFQPTLQIELRYFKILLL